MFRRFIYITLLLSFIAQAGCKNFLDVQPLDRLSGNAFFKSEEDVLQNVWDIYGLFRDATGSCPMFAAAGEMRGGMLGYSVAPTNADGSDRSFVNNIAQNDLLNVVNTPGGKDFWNLFTLGRISEWKPYYRVIQACNILIYELDRREIPGVTQDMVLRYQAEAVFMRCLSYFIMVRLWGDVCYYTEAYKNEPLPREKMTVVVNKCIEELNRVKNALPWTFSDPAYRGARASRGSSLALIMEFNLWNAGFDKGNARKYYEATAAAGKELTDSKNYDLLPIEESFTIFKGRTVESLFDIVINSNYGERLENWNDLSEFVVHWPYKRPANGHQYSFCFIRAEHLRRLYPSGTPDARTQMWFDSQMFANDGTFLFLKYSSIYEQGNADRNVDNDMIVLRYAGAILSYAEALAELGESNALEAINQLNVVRNRARTPIYQGATGELLKEAIFAERTKELMMEGWYYFDLVRTGRVMNAQWCFYPLTQAQFENGGWTWPVHRSALDNNPQMQLNTYWLR